MRRSVETSRQLTPATRAAAEPPPQPALPAEEDFDWAFVGLWTLFVLHSMRRHKVALFAIWFGVVGLLLVLVAILPKTYEVQTTLQAQPASMIGALGAGAASADVDAPAKQAALTVLQHDNLVALVRQTDLIHNWPKNRAPLMRLKDALWARLFPPPSEETQIESFVGLLEQRMWVNTSQGTVTIGIRFPDAQLAYHLVEGAVRNFLEARHAAEISSISDVIFILQSRASQARQSMDDAQRELQELRETRSAKLGRLKRVNKPIPSTPPLDAETSQLLVKIAGKHRAMDDLENFRRRSVDDAEAKLAEVRALYAPSHPLVSDAEQTLQALRLESPQMVTLRHELAALEDELKQRGYDPDAQLTANRPLETPLWVDPWDPREDEDPDIAHAKEQVRHEVGRYNAMLDRLQAAQLEQETAQAAFKYRYVVIWPAQRPRGSIQPNPTLVLLVGLLAGLVLAIVGTTLLDVSSKKIVESWQVERTVGVPLLGEVRLP